MNGLADSKTHHRLRRPWPRNSRDGQQRRHPRHKLARLRLPQLGHPPTEAAPRADTLREGLKLHEYPVQNCPMVSFVTVPGPEQLPPE